MKGLPGSGLPRDGCKAEGDLVMSLYAYCVTRLEKDETWEVFSGIADRPVFAIRHQKIALLASRLERVRLEDQRHVVQHGYVVNRIFEGRTVLPFRFGTLFDSEEHAAAMLRQNHDQFNEGIRLLRGKAEVHVKVQIRPTFAPVAVARHGAPGSILVSGQGYGIAVPSRDDGAAAAMIDMVTRHIRAAFEALEASNVRKSEHNSKRGSRGLGFFTEMVRI